MMKATIQRRESSKNFNIGYHAYINRQPKDLALDLPTRRAREAFELGWETAEVEHIVRTPLKRRLNRLPS